MVMPLELEVAFVFKMVAERNMENHVEEESMNACFEQEDVFSRVNYWHLSNCHWVDVNPFTFACWRHNQI